MFSGNRKVRSTRAKTARDLSLHNAAVAATSPRGQSRHLSKRADEVSSQIHRLECFITDAPRLAKQQRLANVNMVPPMDLPSPARPNGRRVPIAQRRAKRGQKLMLLAEGAVVLGLIAAVVGWLNQWFHFWS